MIDQVIHITLVILFVVIVYHVLLHQTRYKAGSVRLKLLVVQLADKDATSHMEREMDALKKTVKSQKTKIVVKLKDIVELKRKSGLLSEAQTAPMSLLAEVRDSGQGVVDGGAVHAAKVARVAEAESLQIAVMCVRETVL